MNFYKRILFLILPVLVVECFVVFTLPFKIVIFLLRFKKSETYSWLWTWSRNTARCRGTFSKKPSCIKTPCARNSTFKSRCVLLVRSKIALAVASYKLPLSLLVTLPQVFLLIFQVSKPCQCSTIRSNQNSMCEVGFGEKTVFNQLVTIW